MSSEINRPDIISDDALMAPLILSDNMKVLIGTLDQVMAHATKTNEALSGGGSTAKLKKETEELTKDNQELAKVQNQIQKVIQNTNKEYIEQQKTLAKVKKELKEKTVLGERDALTVNRLNASEVVLRAALNKNRAEYALLTSEEERNTKTGQALLKVIQQQDVELKDINATMGKHTDNVGNYEGAMTKLKQELKAAKDQMAGVAAALGEDSEEFKKASLNAGEIKDKIDDLNQATKSVAGEPIERLGGSLGLITDKVKGLDFKGALSGVKQFTAASKDLTFKQATSGLGSFTKGLGGLGKAILTNPLFLLVAVVVGISVAVYKLKDSIKPLTLAFDLVGDAIDYVVQKGKDFLDWLGLSTFALDEKAEATVNAANKEIEAIKKRYDDEIKIADAAGKKVRSLEEAKWNAVIAEATKGIVELNEKSKRNNGKLSEDEKKQWDDFINIVTEANTELQVIRNKAAVEAENKRKEHELKEKGDLFKLQQFRLQIAVEHQEEIIDLEKRSEEDRLAAIAKATDKRIQLALLENEHALDNEKLTTNEKILLSEQLQEKLADIENKRIDEIKKVNEQVAAAEKEAHEKRIAQVIKESEAATEVKTEEVQRQLNLIKEQAIAGNMTREQSEKEYTKVQKQLADDLLQVQIDNVTAILDNEKLSVDERAKFEKELFKLKTELVDAYFNQLDEKQKSQLDKTKAFLETTSQLYTDFSTGIGNLLSAQTDSKLQDIQSEQDANKEAMDKDLEAAGKNEAAKDAIKKEYAKKNEELERKKIDVQRRQAKFDKAQAAVGAAIATALAVTKALPNIPLAVAVGIAGAIQVAAILAKPLPQYAEGTENHPGGLAIVGDGGEHELIKQPGRPLQISPNTSTLMDLAPGSQVFKGSDTMRMLALAGMENVGGRQAGNNSDIKQLGKKLDVLNSTIANKRETHISITKKGMQAAMKNAETKTWWVNELFK